jgi:hypothetical protein
MRPRSRRSMNHTIAVALTSLALVNCAGQTDYVAKLLSPYGYLRVAPPRAELYPGTLVAIDVGDQQSRVEIICRPADAFPGAPPPQIGATETQLLSANAETTYQLEGNYLAAIKANGKYHTIDTISLALSNPKIYEYATSDLYATLSARKQACTDAVSAAQAQNKDVLAVLQAYRADVTYHVTMNTDTSTGIGADTLTGLIAALGASLSAVNSSATDLTLSGSALFWGIYPEKIERVRKRTRGSGPTGMVVQARPLTREERDALVRVPATITSQ